MITFLHDKFKGLLLVLLAVVGISFIFFGNWTPKGDVNPASQTMGKIGGRSLSLNEFAAAQRQALLEITLQTGRIPSAEQSEFLNFQTWIRLLEIQAADLAGLDAGPEQLVEAIKKNPLFQKDKKYDPEIFQRFSANFLSPQGFSGERFDQAVLDQVRTNQLLEALASTAVLFPNQAEDRLQRLFGPVEVQVVRWDSSKVTPPEPKAQDLESFHKANETVFALPARRTVEVVEFLNQGTTEEARRKTAEAAFAFTSQFFNLPEGKSRPDFSAAAGQSKLTVRTHGPFTPSDSPFAGESDPKLTAAAFALTPEDPVSDYLPSKNGYLVLHLRDAQPARNRPLSEITAEVRTRWLEQARLQMALQQAQSFTQTANAALASGQKWEDLSKVASLLPVKLPVFSPADDKPLPFKDADRIRQAVSQMEPRRLSNPIQVEDGLIAVYLVKRDPASAGAMTSTLPKISAQILNQRRSELIRDWITGRASLPENQLPSQVLMQLRGSL
jgi:hypothetical protein